MSFTDHKITQFAHKVSDLPDEPQIPAAELKSRFDACPEELRQSLNAVCDDAARLEARVEGIVVDTFGDTIDKEMLSDELAAELDGKATQTALDSTADALDERLDAVETALPLKCEAYVGKYTGNGAETRTISLGFTPKAVLVMDCTGFTGLQYNGTRSAGGLALPDQPVENENGIAVEIISSGFRVAYLGNEVRSNQADKPYVYLALK